MPLKNQTAQYIFSDWLDFIDHKKKVKVEEGEEPNLEQVQSQVRFIVLAKGK